MSVVVQYGPPGQGGSPPTVHRKSKVEMSAGPRERETNVPVIFANDQTLSQQDKALVATALAKPVSNPLDSAPTPKTRMLASNHADDLIRATLDTWKTIQSRGKCEFILGASGQNGSTSQKVVECGQPGKQVGVSICLCDTHMRRYHTLSAIEKFSCNVDACAKSSGASGDALNALKSDSFESCRKAENAMSTGFSTPDSPNFVIDDGSTMRKIQACDSKLNL